MSEKLEALILKYNKQYADICHLPMEAIAHAMKQAYTLGLAEGRAEGVTGETSDGYHTFNELYDHRCLLYINLWLLSRDGKIWIKDHYPDWDLLVMFQGKNQISYHVPNKYRHLYERDRPAHRIEDYDFDGHTSADVLKRLEALATPPQTEGEDTEPKHAGCQCPFCMKVNSLRGKANNHNGGKELTKGQHP